MTALSPATESVKSAISSAPPVWEAPPTASHALLTKSSIKEAAGLLAPVSFSKALELELLPASITALTVSTR